ncbi:phosphodiesterase [Hwanghaeella grinnelliae]|uniref:Phosphodiesterase n=1 Tax=Hwanghaeella grinnelliae TaxID=2500179 RepID=A0A437QV59_9PROT|nr:phosphodiesterase [Hwanghaeella grinnelliae]RVU38402.1 phosphodiesterase [Hwanghaeella grinnelliae]
MIIAQLSDMHITAPGTLYQGLIPSADMGRAAVDAINAVSPAVDVVVCTGDLTEHGRPEEYAQAREILGALNAPCFVLPGNHDEREAFRAAFLRDGYLPESGPLHYARVIDGLHVVHVDCTVPGEHHGALPDEGLDWLDKTLTAEPDRPTMVLMHFHPVHTGIADVDSYRNFSGVEIGEIIARHPQVLRVLFGHIHRHMTVAFGGTIAMSSPSTVSQILLRLNPTDKSASRMEPPAFLLHHLHADGTMVSHTQPIGDFGPVLDFY